MFSLLLLYELTFISSDTFLQILFFTEYCAGLIIMFSILQFDIKEDIDKCITKHVIRDTLLTHNSTSQLNFMSIISRFMTLSNNVQPYTATYVRKLIHEYITEDIQTFLCTHFLPPIDYFSISLLRYLKPNFDNAWRP